MPSSAPISVSSGMEAAPRFVAAEKPEALTKPRQNPPEKRVFSAVKGKIESQIPSENPEPLQKAVIDIMDYATDWPSGTEFTSGSIATRVGSNPNAPTLVRYDIKRVNENGDYIGVGFGGVEVVLKRSDLVPETIGEKIPKLSDGSVDVKALEQAIPDEQARRYLVAFLSEQKRGQLQMGEVTDKALIMETARSMGYIMSEDIVQLAAEYINPETGKPYITQEDLAQIISPPTEADKQKELSTNATELVGKLGNEQIIDREHAADALLSLGIVTNSGQLERKRFSMEQRKKSLEGTMDKLFGTGTGLETETDFNMRASKERAEHETIVKQLQEIEQLQELTKGGGEWDILKVHMDDVESGGSSADKKDDLLKKTLDPNKTFSQDQLRDLDKSYDEWVIETNVKEKGRKQKAFFKKLVMGGGLGLGGLMAFNIWRARKEEK